MNYRMILAIGVVAATWCAVPTTAAAQKVGAYYRNPYTGSFSYGTYQYDPYTGRNTYGDTYNPYVGPYAIPPTYYYDSYTNTYVATPAPRNPYTGRYFSHYGYDRR